MVLGHRGQAFEVHFMWICNPICYWISMVILQSFNGIINTRHNMDGKQTKKVKNKKNKSKREQWTKEKNQQ